MAKKSEPNNLKKSEPNNLRFSCESTLLLRVQKLDDHTLMELPFSTNHWFVRLYFGASAAHRKGSVPGAVFCTWTLCIVWCGWLCPPTHFSTLSCALAHMHVCQEWEKSSGNPFPMIFPSGSSIAFFWGKILVHQQKSQCRVDQPPSRKSVLFRRISHLEKFQAGDGIHDFVVLSQEYLHLGAASPATIGQWDLALCVASLILVWLLLFHRWTFRCKAWGTREGWAKAPNRRGRECESPQRSGFRRLHHG